MSYREIAGDQCLIIMYDDEIMMTDTCGFVYINEDYPCTITICINRSPLGHRINEMVFRT
jgi:hypothetical protein